MIKKIIFHSALFLALAFGTSTCIAAEPARKSLDALVTELQAAAATAATSRLQKALNCPGGDSEWNNNRAQITAAIDQGADVSVKSNDSTGNTALTLAAIKQDLELVTFCLEHGANVAEVGGTSAMASLPMLKFLLEHGYFESVNTGFFSVLSWTTNYACKPDILACLLENGSSPLSLVCNDHTALQSLAIEAKNHPYNRGTSELEEKCRLMFWHSDVTLASLAGLEEHLGGNTASTQAFVRLLKERRAELRAARLAPLHKELIARVNPITNTTCVVP